MDTREGKPACVRRAHTVTLLRNSEWDLTMLAWIYLVVAAGFVVLAGGTSACPLECECNGPTVACSNASLRTIPSGIPANVTTLDLSNSRIALSGGIFSNFTNLLELNLGWNTISTIEQGSFQGLTNLRTLVLRGNMLQTISRGVFADLRSLQVLDLSQNNIRDTPSGQFPQLAELTSLNLTGNRLQTLPADMLQLFPNLTLLSLSDNPWSCDCNSRWLVTWINQGNASSSAQLDSPSCDEPAGLQGTLLSSLETHNLTCTPPTIHNTSDLHVNTSVYSTVDLLCQARGLPQPTLYWRLPDGRTVPVPHVWTDGDTRFNIGGDGTLRIVNVTASSGGRYVCGANNSVGSDEVTYRVNVIAQTTTTPMPTVGPTNSTPVQQNTTTQQPATTPKQTTRKVTTPAPTTRRTQPPPTTATPAVTTTTRTTTTRIIPTTTTKHDPLANIPWDQFRRDQLGAGLGIPLILLAIGGGVAAWYFMKRKRRKDAARKAEAQDGGYIVANPMALQMDKVEPNGNAANGNNVNVPEIPVDATVIENPSIIETPNGTLVFIPEDNKSYRESKLI